MVSLSSVHLTNEKVELVDLQSLGASHGLSADLSRMYERFYGLKSVACHPDDLTLMLSSCLDGALEQLPDARNRSGHLVYCKTQTHNTLSDRNWLREFADDHHLARWETYSISMTSCASVLVLMHFVGLAQADEPLIILTGEKAFHPSVARLPVGLLAEVPVAALFNAGPGSWNVLGTRVRHLPRFYRNPDAMVVSDRRALQECYLETLAAFIRDSLAAYEPFLSNDFVFLPHNLNLPVTNALLRRFDWADRTFQGDVQHHGHAYCSDIFLNLHEIERSLRHVTAPGTQLLVLAAGTGITFATCLIERAKPATPKGK